MQLSTETVLWFAGIILGILIGLFAWTVNYVVSDNRQRNKEVAASIEKAEHEIKEIKDNYLDRFTRVGENITNSEQRMISAVSNCRSALVDAVHNFEIKFIQNNFTMQPKKPKPKPKPIKPAY